MDRTNHSFYIWISHFCTIAIMFLSSWQNETFYISYIIYDNKFTNTETLINIDWLGIEQWPEICFQVFNMPKMKFVELSTQISIPDDSIKILIRHVCSMYHRSNHHCKMLNLAEFTHYITISITQTPKL